MSCVKGDFVYLTDDSIGLSQKILSRFTLSPCQRTYEDKPTYIAGLAGPCCCDKCPMNTVCCGTGRQCQAFRHFVANGRWSDDDLAVDLK